MAAGPKHHRITLQRDDGTARDANGEHVPSWTTLATVWAEGGAISGDELWAARMVQSKISHQFRCRIGTEILDLRGDVRVIFRDRVLHVVAAVDVGELGREWQLDCTEAGDDRRAILDPGGSALLEPETGDVIREP